jgi:hypothetical protein
MGVLILNDFLWYLIITNIIIDDLNDIVGPKLLNGFNQGIYNITTERVKSE